MIFYLDFVGSGYMSLLYNSGVLNFHANKEFNFNNDTNIEGDLDVGNITAETIAIEKIGCTGTGITGQFGWNETNLCLYNGTDWRYTNWLN